MKTEVFAICDAATLSEGKLNLLGVFDTIFTKTMPAVHPQCAVAVRLRGALSEEGEHKMTVKIIEKGAQTIIASMEITMKFVPDRSLPTGSVNYVFNIQSLKLEHFGEHSIDLGMDGKEIESIPLYLRQIPNSQLS
jgi:hypothetical protein